MDFCPRSPPPKSPSILCTEPVPPPSHFSLKRWRLWVSLLFPMAKLDPADSVRPDLSTRVRGLCEEGKNKNRRDVPLQKVRGAFCWEPAEEQRRKRNEKPSALSNNIQGHIFSARLLSSLIQHFVFISSSLSLLQSSHKSRAMELSWLYNLFPWPFSLEGEGQAFQLKLTSPLPSLIWGVKRGHSFCFIPN